MAQVTDPVYSSQIVGKKESIVDEIFYLDPMDTPFLQKIGMGPNGPLNTLRRTMTNPSYSWPETALTTNRTTLAAAMDNSQTTMDLTDNDWLRAGDRCLVDLELIDITTVASGDPSVVVRGVADTTAAAHAAGAVVVNLGIARAQGSAPTDGFGDQPALVTNQSQIWVEEVQVAGTVLATEAYGRTSEYDELKAQKMRRIKEQLEHSVLFNGTAVAAVAGSTAGRMAGGLKYIASNVRALGGAQLEYNDVQAVMESIYNAGGTPDCMITGSFNKRVITDWKLPHIRYEGEQQSGSQYGASVGKLETDYGPIDVICKRSFPQSLVMIVSSQNVGVGPLQGNGNNREFTHEFLGKDGDRVRGEIIGEYTCEWRLEKSHGLITGTAVS